jgi:hypothetical protein
VKVSVSIEAAPPAGRSGAAAGKEEKRS